MNEEVLKYFVFIIIRRLNDERKFLGFPNLRFVFKENDLLKLHQDMLKSKNGRLYYIDMGLSNYKEYLMIDDINRSMDYLIKNRQDYYNYQINGPKVDDDELFLEVTNLKKFSYLLEQIVCVAQKQYNPSFACNLLYSIWLRMTPTDFQNVLIFLDKQLNFLTCDNYIECGTLQSLLDNYKVTYETLLNDHTWFETNKKIVFTLSKNKAQLYLPMIHYGILDNGKEKIGYVYGIQDDNTSKNNDSLSDFTSTKKFLRNKYVKYTFVLALRYFMMLLKEKGIKEVRFPLLEVLDYSYHENLSMIAKDNFTRNYDTSKIAYLEKQLQENNLSEEVKLYLREKEWYSHVVNKQDIISKNKTERLVETILVLQEKYGILDIMNDPFVEDDHLYVKIK